MKRFGLQFYSNLIVFLMLVSVLNVYGQDGQGGTESNLSAGFGARAMGLGQAYTAMANDPTAVYWNPAGLEYVNQQSATLFHMSLFEGTIYDFLGMAYPTLNLGTFGFAVGRIGVGDIKQTDIQKNELGTFSWDEYQVFFSYAKRLPWNITSGLTVRVVRRAWNNLSQEGDLNDVGVGMDLGFLYKPELFTSPVLKDWSLGLSVRNLFAPQVKEGNDIDESPLGIRFGLLKKIYTGGIGNHLNLLIDLDYSQKRDMRLHFGTEYRFRNMGVLRAGFDGSSPTFGGGIEYSIVQIDYAFGNSVNSDVFPAVHRFSLTFNFGMNRSELLEIAAANRKAEEDRLIADMREADRQRFIAEHLQNAEAYFQDRQLLDAIVEYKQVLQQDAFNTQATVMLDSSEALLQKQVENEQIALVQEALDKERAESDRAYVAEHLDKGRLYLDENQFTKALIEFNLALERVPESETVLSAINTTERRRSEELSRMLVQIRQDFQSGNYSEALRLASDARLLGGDDQGIQDEIDTLIERIRLQENIQKGLGFYEIGEYDRALQLFEEAMQIDPEDELVKQYYERTKIETVGKTEEMDPATERRFLQGVDFFVKGKYQQAIDIWEKILEEHPYNKKVLKALEGARDRLNKSK